MSDKDKNDAENLFNNPDKLEKFLKKLEKYLSSVPIAGSTLQYVPLMISLLRAYMKGDYKKIPIDKLIIIVAALLYVLNPLDVIPDTVPAVGFADDAGAIALALTQVKLFLDAYKKWRNDDGNAQPV